MNNCNIQVIDVGANGRSPVHQGRSPVHRGHSPVHHSSMQSKSIGSFIAGFKSSFTTKMNRLDGMPGRKLWQRNYWEHIIRNENEYNRIAQYIIDNPKKWAMDKLNGGVGNQIMESLIQYEMRLNTRGSLGKCHCVERWEQ